MKLLVTGGAGFIGSAFVRYWVKKYPDDQLVNFDKLTYAGNLDNVAEVEGSPNYKFVKGDICDRATVDQAMDGVDTVVHFAAETHVDRSIDNASPFIMTNVVGTHVLLESALQHKVNRFHHISTDEVFGSLELGSSEKFNENTCYAPRSPYSASKAASDHLVRAYNVTYDLPITISNCSNNFGPYMFPEKLIPLAITNIIQGKKVPVYGDGLNVRDWLYVDDHVTAIEAILQKGNIGETYFIGSTVEEINNIDLIKKILKLMGRGEDMIEFVEDRKGHDRRYAIDWSKIHNELGWSPAHNFDEYLKMTIDWYTENEEYWKKLK